MYTVREADVKNVFHGISSSIEGMSLAMYMAEMASALSPTGDEAAKELRLLLNCFYMISEKKADLRVIKAVFELRTMSECTFSPPFGRMIRKADSPPPGRDKRPGRRRSVSYTHLI